mgnify:CR=1 FL=1
MNFSAWSIRNPIAPILAFALLLMLGWQAFNSLPITRFPQMLRFAKRCGASVPDWLQQRFDGLDDDPDTRRLIAANVAIEQVRRLQEHGIQEFHFYTLNRAELTYAICHALGVRAPAARTAAEA